eukprot:gene9655-12997_t
MTERIDYEWRVIHNGEGNTPNVRANAASWIYKDSLWIVGGEGAGLGKSSEVWKFSFVEKCWKKMVCTGEPPSPRDGHTATYIGGSKFIIFGGQGFPYPNNKLDRAPENFKIRTYLVRELYNDLYQFDCDTLAWSPIHPDGLNFPMGRRGHTAVYIPPGGAHWTFPSTEQTTPLSSPLKNTQRHKSSSSSPFVSTPHSRSKALPPILSPHKNSKQPITVSPNSLIVFGGSGIELSKYTELIYNDLWSFSFDSLCWTRLESGGIEPKCVFNHGMERIGDALVVIGGISTISKMNTDFSSPGSSNNDSTSDIMLYDLKNASWSYLKIFDNLSRPARFNYHGFSIAVDYLKNPNALYLFGGREVADKEFASKSKASNFPKSYPSHFTFVLDISEKTLLPIPITISKESDPVNRYGHVGLPIQPVNVTYEHRIHANDAKPKRNLQKLKMNNIVDNHIENARTYDPLMFLYGGSGIESVGYCDPIIYELVKVTSITIDTNELINNAVASLNNADDVSEPDDATHATNYGKSVAYDQTTALEGIMNNVTFQDMPLEFSNSGFRSSSLFENSNNMDYIQSNIWNSRQTQIFIQNNHGKTATAEDISPPSDWFELKLALSPPLSDRISMNEKVESSSRKNTANSVFNPHKSNILNRSSSLSPLGKSFQGNLSGSLNNINSPDIRPHTSAFAGTLNSRSGSLKLGTPDGDRPIVPAVRHAHTAPDFGRSGLNSQPQFNKNSTLGKHLLKEKELERKLKIKNMKEVLKPYVMSKTKVDARQEFLKLFPLPTPDAL